MLRASRGAATGREGGGPRTASGWTGEPDPEATTAERKKSVRRPMAVAIRNGATHNFYLGQTVFAVVCCQMCWVPGC